MRSTKRLGVSKSKGIFLTLAFAFLFVMVVLESSMVSASLLRTTNQSGQTQHDFSPGELVYIKGTGFKTNWVVDLNVTRPDNSIDFGAALTNGVGSFTYAYDFGGMVGNYSVYASDGFVMKQVNFTDAAIWSTRDDCGNQTQNVNSYAIGDMVFVNGDGFAAGNYSWEIKGQPGGASCDPNTVVASGVKVVNATGKFCFNAYTVANDDCGVYAIKFSNKGDNYHVEGGSCEDDSDCGAEFSELQCSGLNVINATSFPLCSDGECLFGNSSQFVTSCGSVKSGVTCIGNNVTNITNVPSCSVGECLNNTIVNTLEVCDFGCSAGACNEAVCGNGVPEGNETCDDGNLNNTDSCKNDCTLSFCGDQIVSVGEQCDDGNLNNTDSCTNDCKLFVCEDEDSDGICDPVDYCPGSMENEPVDENGCDIFQFCSGSGLSCGDSCLKADWKDNEPNSEFPNDCTVVFRQSNGIIQEPVCVPTEFSQQCAG